MNPILYHPFKGSIFITQRFGLNPQMYAKYGMKGHNGIDYRTRTPSTPQAKRHVYPMQAGHVIKVENQDTIIKGIKIKRAGYGLYIRLQHADGAQSVYGHLSASYVREGDYVGLNTVIGMTGNSGDSTGPHLHAGYRPAGWGKLLNNGFKGYVDQLPFTHPRPS